jgi:hypothetical protein
MFPIDPLEPVINNLSFAIKPLLQYLTTKTGLELPGG